MKVTVNDIGRILFPIDNSYSQDLTTGSEYIKANDGHGLAGTIFKQSAPVKIISPPYNITFTNIVNKKEVYEMVIVEYENKPYLILNDFTTRPVPIDPIIDHLSM